MASRARQTPYKRKPPWLWRRRRLFHSLDTLLEERVERFKSFNSLQTLSKVVGRVAKTSFINHIFMKSFFSSRRHFTWGKFLACCLLKIWMTSSLLEKPLTAAISHISSASAMLECWQNLSKLNNQRVFQILVYPERPFVKFTPPPPRGGEGRVLGNRGAAEGHGLISWLFRTKIR